MLVQINASYIVLKKDEFQCMHLKRLPTWSMSGGDNKAKVDAATCVSYLDILYHVQSGFHKQLWVTKNGIELKIKWDNSFKSSQLF